VDIDGARAHYDIFSTALRIRMVEERIAEQYTKNKMRCPTHLSIGQELPAVLVSRFLSTVDTAVSSHRCHAHYLAKGGDLNAMIAEIHGKETGCSLGRGGSMHLIDKEVGFMGSTGIVGNSIPLGVGLAMAHKLGKTDAISCIYFGDGATEEGAYYEALSFAAVKQLPALFVCEHNRYSVYSALDVRQPRGRSIAAVAQSIGVEAIELDSTDVKACLRSMSQIIRNMRSSKLPALVEFSTYRYREHCGPLYDDHLGYRAQEEYNYHYNRDPLNHPLKSCFKNCLTQTKLRQLEQEVTREIDEAFLLAEAANFPSYNSLKNSEFM